MKNGPYASSFNFVAWVWYFWQGKGCLLAVWLVGLKFFCKTGRQWLLPFPLRITLMQYCGLKPHRYPFSSVHSVVTVFIHSLIRKQHQVRPDPRHCRQRAPPQQRWDPRACERPHLCNSASASKQQPETQCTRSSMEV